MPVSVLPIVQKEQQESERQHPKMHSVGVMLALETIPKSREALGIAAWFKTKVSAACSSGTMISFTGNDVEQVAVEKGSKMNIHYWFTFYKKMRVIVGLSDQ